MSGAQRIAAERQRQIDIEGYSAERDAGHLSGDLVAAARAYTTVTFQQIAPHCGWTRGMVDEIVLDRDFLCWPWDGDWWNPSDDPIRNLEKAGALIAAEIDRLLAERGEAS